MSHAYTTCFLWTSIYYSDDYCVFVKKENGQLLEWKQTGGLTDPTDRIILLANAVGWYLIAS